MDMLFRVALLMLSVFLFALHANDANAVYNQGNQKTISAKQAAKIVQKKYGGKVLKVNKQSNNVYKIKIVKANGQVISKKVNARTGKIQQN